MELYHRCFRDSVGWFAESYGYVSKDLLASDGKDPSNENLEGKIVLLE